MPNRSFLLASVAAFALVGCGNSDDSSAGQSVAKTAISASKASSGSPLDKAFKVSNGEALDIDAIFTMVGYDGPKPYASSSFDAKTGATILNDLRFDDGDGAVLTIAKAELYGVDQDVIDRVINGTGAHDAPFETMFQKVRLFGLNVDIDEGAFTGSTQSQINEFDMSLGGVEIDRLNVRQGGMPDDLSDGAELASIFNLFDLGGLYFKDYNLSFSGDQVGTFQLAAPDFRIVGFGGGKLNAVVANDFEYNFKQSKESMQAALSELGPQAQIFLDGPLGNILGLNGQRVKAKTMTWRDIDASGLMAWGLKGEMPPMSERNLISLGDGEISDYEQFIGDKRLMKAKSSTFSMDEFTWLIPNKIRSDVKDATYDLTAYVGDEQGEILTALTSRGLNEVKGDGFFAWNWNDKSGAADFSYGGTTDKFADFDLTFNAGNLKFDEIATLVESENQAGMLGIGSFNKFNLKIKDKNLLGVIYDVAALQMGAGTGDDLRQSAPAMLRLSSGQFTSLNPLFSDYVDAVASFLGEGGTLEISAAPSEPLPFAQLGVVSQTAPITLPDVMNLTVKHSK